MRFRTKIKRRTGRMTVEHTVLLDKKPEDYVQGECFTIAVGGRDMPVRVEIPVKRNSNDVLSVVLDVHRH